jgi:hypothetical protein
MTKHNGYDLVRPMFTSGKLKGFTAIFKLVPKSVVAVDLGKEKGRFNRLIEDPDDLIYQEIRLFGALCDMAPFEMGILIEMEHPSPATNDPQKDYKYEAIRPAFETKTIRYLDDIFKYIPRSAIAKEIGRKGSTLDRYIKNVDSFPVKDIRAVGSLFDLKLSEMLTLIEAQAAK